MIQNSIGTAILSEENLEEVCEVYSLQLHVFQFVTTKHFLQIYSCNIMFYSSLML